MKTNRDYFSWSQYHLFNTSKKQFYKKYGLGEKSISNKQFEKGKEFAHYKETGEILPSVINPDMLEVVGGAVDELDIMEHKLKVQIDKYNLLAYADSGKKDYTQFYEYKTGQEPWTQKDVEKHEQLDFYAVCYYIASGEKIIPSCKLYWIETQKDDKGQLYFTGNVEEFERTFDKQDIVNMMAKIITTIDAIDEFEYKELELDDDKIDRYIHLDKIIKDAQEEQELIKLEVENLMINNNVKYASSSRGSFSISERKNKIFPEKINKLQKQYKDEIDRLKKEAEKSGDMKIKVSESLRFTLKK